MCGDSESPQILKYAVPGESEVDMSCLHIAPSQEREK